MMRTQIHADQMVDAEGIEPMISEIYRLRLDHYMQDNDGQYPIEEPLIVQMVYDRQHGNLPICLNDMIDKMRDAVLRKAERRTDE